MEKEEFIYQEEYKRDSYKLLSECYYLPDERLLTMLDGLDKSRWSLRSEIAQNIPATNAIETLKIDYSRLFGGPYRLLAPPYGSVYLENTRMVMGDSTMDVKRKYEEEGLNVSLKEAPDHIAIELEFMYYLIFKEVEAILNSDSVNTTDYLKKRKDFLETHLGIWISEFAYNVEANAQTTFYKNLARITKSFIRKELENLSINSISVKKPAQNKLN
jgi:TorA maturation chaperone TorD